LRGSVLRGSGSGEALLSAAAVEFREGARRRPPFPGLFKNLITALKPLRSRPPSKPLRDKRNKPERNSEKSYLPKRKTGGSTA